MTTDKHHKCSSIFVSSTSPVSNLSSCLCLPFTPLDTPRQCNQMQDQYNHTQRESPAQVSKSPVWPHFGQTGSLTVPLSPSSMLYGHVWYPTPQILYCLCTQQANLTFRKRLHNSYRLHGIHYLMKIVVSAAIGLLLYLFANSVTAVVMTQRCRHFVTEQNSNFSKHSDGLWDVSVHAVVRQIRVFIRSFLWSTRLPDLGRGVEVGAEQSIVSVRRWEGTYPCS